MKSEGHPADVHFPPAPWHLRGRMWAGLFRTDAPVPLPAPLKRVLGARWLVVLLVRYEPGGTLRYDELALGIPARRGLRFGLWVDALWVSDAAGMWGGRRIWGLPKQMARFDWEEDGSAVRVEDAAGVIARFTLDRSAARLPAPWLPAPFWGRREDASLIFTPARVRGARLGRGGLRRVKWSDHLPYRPAQRPLISVAAASFRLTVPPPA
jgi:hypothetical protein